MSTTVKTSCSLEALMAKVGWFLFEWGVIEGTLDNALTELERAADVPAQNRSANFPNKLKHWRDLRIKLGGDAQSREVDCLTDRLNEAKALRDVLAHGIRSPNADEASLHCRVRLAAVGEPTQFEAKTVTFDEIHTMLASLRKTRHVLKMPASSPA